MSEYSFGTFEGDALDLGEQAPPNAEPKWYRERMDKVSDQMKSMADELKALRAKDVNAELAKKFEAAGVNPGATALYTGDPDKADDWLSANKGLLAQTGTPAAEGAGEAEQQAPTGPVPTVVSPEGQAQIAAMQAAGATGAAPPQGSDQEQAAAIAAITSEADYAAYMRSHGNRFF